MAQNEISIATIQRLPIYLDYLKSLGRDVEFISATALAQALGFGEVQVRKDLASVCSSGKPKVGYNTEELKWGIEDYLGYNHANNAIVVGAGSLGCALLGYEGFSRYGLNILAAFDVDAAKIGSREREKPILSIDDLGAFCKREQVHIGIITVPASHAQTACDALTASGILAIWNFAPVHLDVSEGVILKNENMACSLAVLSTNLARRMENREQEKEEQIK